MKRAPRTIGGSPGFAGRTRPVLGDDAAVVRLDDLLGDRQAEAGVLAEGLLLGAVGVEALEDPLELVGADARAVVLDHDLERIGLAPHDDAHDAVLAAEGAGIVDQVVEDLAEPAVVAEDEIGVGLRPARCRA